MEHNLITNKTEENLTSISIVENIVPEVNLITYLKTLDKLPIKSSDISFSSNTWELCFIDEIYKKKKKYICQFSDINFYYRDIIKGLVYKYIVLDNIGTSTLDGKLQKVRHFLNYIEGRHIYSFSLINLKVIKEFLEGLNGDSRNYDKYRSILESLLTFVDNNLEGMKYRNIFIYLKKNKKTKEIKAEREQGKTPDIPEDIFDSMEACAINDIKDPLAEKQWKIQACIILLLSQTGVRISELRLFKANNCFEHKIFDNDDPVFYLKYVSPKSNIKDAKTFLTDKGKLAYDCIVSLTEEKRFINGTDYIFTNKKDSVFCEEYLSFQIVKFFVRHYKDINCINRRPEEIKGFKVIKLSNILDGTYYIPKNDIPPLPIDATISSPTSRQFRVAVCNRLINSNPDINIDWIREHMNHLEGETTLHYYRKRERIDKEREFSKSILKAVINDEYKLIGKDNDILMAKIHEFIQKNKYNIKDDIDVIAKELSGKVPIKQKSGGFCIKGAYGRKCSYDGYDNDIYCAFGLCANHFTTYKMIDITYKNYINLKASIVYNLDSGYETQAATELNKLKRVVGEALIPQLNELEKEILTKGFDNILAENKELESLINNRQQLNEEVLLWKSKSIKEIMEDMIN